MEIANSAAIASVLTLLTAIGAILIFDLFLYIKYGREGTISRGVYQWGLRYKWLSWTFVISGISLVLFLAWHFWWG